MESGRYAQGKAMEYAQAFRNLVMLYDEHGQGALSLQLEETANILEKLTGIETGKGDITQEQIEAVECTIEGLGCVVECIQTFEAVRGHLQFVVRIAKKHKGVIYAKDIALAISDALSKKFCISKSSRQIVTKETGEYIFEEQPKFRTLFGHASRNKDNSRISGDNYSFLGIDGARTVIGLSDGMGCGNEANRQSTRFIDLLEQLLMAGFEEEKAIKLLNNVFADNDMTGNPVTLDLCVLSGYEGTADIYKMGCATGFVKRRDRVEIINVSSMPAGVFLNLSCDRKKIQLNSGDYMIMMSDGVLDALPFYDKEKKMQEIIESIDEKIPQKIADRLINEAVFYNEKIADDMTVLVTGIWAYE